MYMVAYVDIDKGSVNNALSCIANNKNKPDYGYLKYEFVFSSIEVSLLDSAVLELLIEAAPNATSLIWGTFFGHFLSHDQTLEAINFATAMMSFSPKMEYIRLDSTSRINSEETQQVLQDWS